MTKKDFITKYLPLAQKAGEAFRINPVVILAQAAIETGWGQSDLCLQHHNFFGITAYGKKNVWWTGTSVQLSTNSLSSVPIPTRYTLSWTMPACSATPTPMRPTSATNQLPLPSKSVTANTSAK